MSFIGFLKDRWKPDKNAPATDGYHNPYAEKLLLSVDVLVDGQPQTLEVREIRNKEAKVMGAQSVVQIGSEKVPILVSSPRNDTFSMGVNIALPRELMGEFREELQRLKDEGQVSQGAKLSYNPDTKNAILWRASDSQVNGNLPRWRDVCSSSMQALVDDTAACMPYILHLYGE